eukprot:CAMPEP_0197496530 /NCGR_PEP_ID=MMETSP1311-20131121/45247_1 /TAXON_ID=464262 /ORGANISM="Genus nov. species nov., Strain RCC856" /LENGTH=30 /DNA_ID= /DNA_START= /DNA_END= /DNA_ORIENTATION=
MKVAVLSTMARKSGGGMMSPMAPLTLGASG